MKYIMKLVLAIMVIIITLSQVSIVAAVSPQEVNLETLPEWKVTNSSRGGTLLFSDSPEMVSTTGILYQDKVEGNARLFFYHVNSTRNAKKMDVLLQNTGHEVAHVTVNRYSLGGPGYAWMAVGKEAMASYLSGKSSVYQINIPSGGVVPLSTKISETAVLPNMLINGIFDFVVDRPVIVKVMMRPLFEDSEPFAKTAKILPADQFHLRGTFAGANRQLVPKQTYDPVGDGAVAVTIADNEVDPYLEGIDATDGSKVVNYGNYGVVYQIPFPSQHGGKIAYYLAPLGGEYAGAIGIQHPDVYWSPLATPQGRESFGSKSGDFAFLGTFDGGDSLTFTFSPPGASNLPVRIVVLPQ